MARQRGFTLIEMAFSIAIIGIVAASGAVFLKPTVEAYFAMERRAELSDQADTALRVMGRDIRSAVPDSARSASSQCFEIIPTNGTGVHRKLANPRNGLAPGCFAAEGCTAASGGHDSGQFSLVPMDQQVVSYICAGADGTVDLHGDGKGVLYRKQAHGFSGSPVACPSIENADVVATHLTRCGFAIGKDRGAPGQSAFVTAEMELTRDNESVTFFHSMHLDAEQ